MTVAYDRLPYLPNRPSTWGSVRGAVLKVLSEYSGILDRYSAVVDGTCHNDVVAQRSASLEEYRLKYVVAFGSSPPDMSEAEFRARKSVVKRGDVYVGVELNFVDGESVYIEFTICS